MQVSSPVALASALRIGAPPLRFKGWFLTRHERAPLGRPELFLELWKRQRGGFTVMFSRWQGQKWQADAMTATSLDSLMQDVETYCATLGTAGDTDESSPDQLQRIAQRQQDFTSFLHLVGHALDDWDMLNAEGEDISPPLTVSG